ncbi:MAG: YibE/F family protein [Peptococcaceae bacterium]
MKKAGIFVLFVILFFLLRQTIYAQETTPGSDPETGYIKGEVIEVVQESVQSASEKGMPSGTQVFKVKITTGGYKNEIITIENVTTGNPAFDSWVTEGDKLVLAYQAVKGKLDYVDIEDYERDKYIYRLIGLFILLLVLIGQGKGLKSVITLTITILIVVEVMLPLLFKGYDPVIVALLAGVIITFFTLVIVGGITRKTISAILGTSGGLLAASEIAMYFGKMAHLRGVREEEAQILMSAQGVNFDFQGLLFAAMIIGALGAVMDVSMSIASSINEVSNVGRGLGMIGRIRSGMNVGRDIMGTMSNTLILAYTGSSLPLMLLLMAYEPPFLKVINADYIATELIRSLSGSMGLILSIPITAIMAGVLMGNKN